MSPSPLENLPSDVLYEIFRAFCLHCSAKESMCITDKCYSVQKPQQHPNEKSWYSVNCNNLFSLCLVSRTLRDVAQSILYHAFCPGYGDSWRSQLYSWDGRMTGFLRTIIYRPDLASMVRRLYVHPFLIEAITPNEAWLVAQQASSKFRLQSLRKDDAINNLLSVLIAATPRLAHFGIQLGDQSGNWSASLVLNGITPPNTLKTIDISTRLAACQKQEHGLSRLFSLPSCAGDLIMRASSLEHLNLHMCSRLSDDTSVFHLPNLKTLRITFSRLGNADIERFLSSCQGLQSFFYEATELCEEWRQGNFVRYTDVDHFRFVDVIGSLSRHCQSLKSLHLDLRGRGYLKSSEERSSMAKLSLEAFSHLEHLFVNAGEIPNEVGLQSDRLLVDILPPRIVSLHLAKKRNTFIHCGNFFSTNEEPLAGKLLDLACAVQEGKFKRLKEVKCDRDYGLRKYGFVEKFKAVGIEFGYAAWPFSHATLDYSDVPPSQLVSRLGREVEELMPLPDPDDWDL